MLENIIISSCGLEVASPNTPFTVAAICKVSRIGYVILCGMVEAEIDTFIESPAETNSTNCTMVAILYIEYFHHNLSSKCYVHFKSLEMFNY